MKNLSINNKSISDSYQPSPSKYYDIEGKLTEKNGKEIKIEKEINNKMVEYSLKLTEEIDSKVGEEIRIEKEKILSASVEDKTKTEEDEEVSRSAEAILRELGLEYTEENLRMVDEMLRSGIRINKTSVESYKRSKECIDNIVKIDERQIGRLLDRGIDVENESLENLSKLLEEDHREEKFSLKRFLKLDGDMDYKEAEKISKEIYGTRMGKDVYDVIISLDREGIPISRENIESSLEVLKKVYDLKDFNYIDLTRIIDGDMDFNIENLYRIKNNYTRGSLVGGSQSSSFESFNTIGNVSIENVRQVLVDLDLEPSDDNIKVFRDFLMKDINMSKENIETFKDMKANLVKLKEILASDQIVSLQEASIDVLKEDIGNLVKYIERTKQGEKVLLENIDLIDSIGEEDLLKLIKQGKDFNLENIKEILDQDISEEVTLEYKVLATSKIIKDLIGNIGRDLSSGLIARAKELGDISLVNLSNARAENIVDTVIRDEDLFLQEEYNKFKNNITTNIIKESILEGKLIETMDLAKLNKYMDKKIDRYREVSRLSQDFKSISLNKDEILPLILRNDLELTMAEIANINSFLKGKQGISNLLNNLDSSSLPKAKKEDIKRIKSEISDGLKSGEDISDIYTDLMANLSDFKDGEANRDQENPSKYFELKEKLLKKSNVFQIPIEMGSSLESLNIILGNGKIDKSNMDFLLNINSKHLGNVNMNVRVLSRDIFIDLKEEHDILKDDIENLSGRLSSIGYNLILGDRDEN